MSSGKRISLKEKTVHQIKEDYINGWSEQDISYVNGLSRRQVRNVLKDFRIPEVEQVHREKNVEKNAKWRQSAKIRAETEGIPYIESLRVSRSHALKGRIATTNPFISDALMHEIIKEGSP